METHLKRSIDCPIREGLSYTEIWDGPDGGYIFCWETGRNKRRKNPELAARAEKGELVPIDWKRGSLRYLATWQGLRGEDLNISFVDKTKIVCTKTKKNFTFKVGPVKEE